MHYKFFLEFCFFYYRYAFTPLLDAPDDDGDETELFIKEIYNGRIIIALL